MSTGEKIGAALAKAVKGTAAKIKDDQPATKMYRTNMRDVPKVEGLKREDGWIDMQVQFLIDKKTAGANHVVGWTVLKPTRRWPGSVTARCYWVGLLKSHHCARLRRQSGPFGGCTAAWPSAAAQMGPAGPAKVDSG